MEFRRICDDTSSMGMWELAHNHVFVKNGEAWYRDFEREISVRDLMREICSKHGSPADAGEMENEMLDEVLMDNLQYGTDELEGIFALLNMTLWGMADVRAWLYEAESKQLLAMQEKAKSILLRLHNAGGCDAKDERSKGWDEAITEAIRIVEEETGMRTEEVLD